MNSSQDSGKPDDAFYNWTSKKSQLMKIEADKLNFSKTSEIMKLKY